MSAEDSMLQELKSISNLLERIATSQEHTEALLTKMWDQYTIKLGGK
jgi:hypothetical protein